GQADADGDGIGDACDPCPLPGDGDSDGDGVCDGIDRCEGFPDDLDPDHDLRPSACDLCPNTFDPLQRDSDGDGFGDACDICPDPTDPVDTDGDGLCDGADQCPEGNDHVDADHDGLADACDPCPLDPYDDADADGVCDSDDRCAGVDDFGPDRDFDGWPDACDDCPDTWSELQGDFDGDGFGDACDCRVGNAAVNPGAVEVCNGIDDDCNGEIDDGVTDAIAVWRDADGDGQGDPAAPSAVCEPTAGFVTNDNDCDDGSADAKVGGTEVCDGLDNDCDGVVDPDCAEQGAESVGRDATGCGCNGDGWGGSSALLLLFAARRRKRT
ncbi:MAG: putative metal-binding motif-containing protein, partial [Myxococcales bacterium]|nr:putative metal-binding motif-containing protein [Myxococcales bacterium]